MTIIMENEPGREDKKPNKGFSWPFIIIIALTSIFFMLAVMVPSYTINTGKQRQLTICQSNLRKIAAALELFAADNGGKYPGFFQELVPTYLTAVPSCPSAGIDTYSGSYQSAEDPHSFTVYCSGSNHMSIIHQADYPRYSSIQGLIVYP